MQGDDFRTLRSADELDALAPDWNELTARCPTSYISQTHRWAAAAWRHVAAPRGRALHCLTLRSQGRLVAVWPLVVERRGALTVVRPLGPEASEYCSPLVEPGTEEGVRTKRLWREAARLGDLALLPYVRSDSALTGLLGRAGWWRAPDLGAPAPFLARGGYADFAAYQKTQPASLRQNLRRVRRRLAEKGSFTLGAEDPAQTGPVIDWLLDSKKRWLESEGLGSDWIGRRDYRDFLVALAKPAESPLVLFALKVEGTPIAAKLATVDRTRLESHIDVYDPQWSFCAPGKLVNEHCVAWAFERGLDFDLRVGDEPYKREWAPLTCETTSWYIATGWRALPLVARRRAVLLSWQLRSRLRRLLGRGRGP
jgi:CelD/BcsL family acetyltransferase involved in cellulose biosynthesis